MNGGQDFSTLPRDAVDVAALIHAQRRVRAGCCELDLHVSPALQNPMHNLHGGISLCASDLAASITQETSPRPLTTASIHVVYARPVPGGALATFAATLRHGGRSLGLVDVVGSVDGMRCTVAQVTLQ